MDSYNILQLPRASLHYDGLGIQFGIDFDSTLQVLRALRRNRDGKEKRWADDFASSRSAALETILTGASWPQARIASCFNGESAACLLCGHPFADALHTYYLCPVVNAFDDDNVQDTNDLAIDAVSHADTYPCMYFRGPMPTACTQLPDEHLKFYDSYLYTYDLNAPPIDQWPSGDYFGDGGGGRIPPYVGVESGLLLLLIVCSSLAYTLPLLVSFKRLPEQKLPLLMFY